MLVSDPNKKTSGAVHVFCILSTKATSHVRYGEAQGLSVPSPASPRVLQLITYMSLPGKERRGGSGGEGGSGWDRMTNDGIGCPPNTRLTFM